MSKVVTQHRPKPSLNVSKGDDSYFMGREGGKDEWSDSDGSGEEDLSGEDEEEVDCPLCLEDMDESDQHFFPCPCQYQICRFCWHKIREEGNEKCPACRRTYTDEDVVFTPVHSTPSKEKKAASKKQQQQKRKVASGKKEETIPSRKVLSEYRVIQRNLVYVIGISARIAHENILKEPEYFGQYGKIVKIVVNRRNLATNGTIQTTTGNGGATSATTTGPSASAYITFVRKEDAARCIASVDGSVFDGRVLRATYGTTKYCSYFLRGMTCTNAGCMYLHEEGEHIDSFTKDELTAGKMHLHSYVLDKNEAATMKQFGVLQKPPAPTVPAPQPTAVRPAAPVSKPSTPVSQQIPVPFLDRTPSSFFERLSQLAARHRDDLFEEADSKPTSPPPVMLPPSRRATFRFDPFTTADLTAIESPARPPPPPPIGSPVGRKTGVPPGMSPRQPLFSESVEHSLSSPVASRAPPAWLQPTAGQPQQPKLEPSVEQFFNLFSNGALSTNPSATEAQVAPSPTNPEQQATTPTSVEEPSPFLFDPHAKSIFDDPAIVQARQVNKPKPLPASLPTSPTAPKVQPSVMPPSKSGEFVTVSQNGPKKTSSVQPSSKKAKAKTSPPMVIQEPVFTNQYEALLLEQTPPVAKSTPVTPSVKKTKTKVSPTLAIDPAVIASSTHPSVAAASPLTTAPYQRVTILPRARKTDASLISVDISTLDLDQLNDHIAKLEAALQASHEDSRQIEAFMRDILRKSWPATSTRT